MSLKEKNPNYSNYLVFSEILFIVLPIITIIIIDAAKGSLFGFFDRPDISFCSVLFSGQMIIKLVSVLLKRREKIHWQFISFLIAMIICVGLIPSLLFFVFLQEEKPEVWIKIAQLVWFIVLIWIYFEVAGYAQEKDDE